MDFFSTRTQCIQIHTSHIRVRKFIIFIVRLLLCYLYTCFRRTPDCVRSLFTIFSLFLAFRARPFVYLCRLFEQFAAVKERHTFINGFVRLFLLDFVPMENLFTFSSQSEKERVFIVVEIDANAVYASFLLISNYASSVKPTQFKLDIFFYKWLKSKVNKYSKYQC